MNARILFFLVLIICSFSLMSQEPVTRENSESNEKPKLKFAGDSRFTIIDKSSVSIYGARLGLLFKDKFEVGAGVYSSNLFGLLGSSVNKEYVDDSFSPSAAFNSEIGFHYFSLFGEYRLVNTKRVVLTLNTQVGLGWASIEFTEPNENKDTIRRMKSLVEHSLKVDVQTFDWLRLIGGVGYRYLLDRDEQLQDSFNAPIYIIGFSIDYGLLKRKIFDRNK